MRFEFATAARIVFGPGTVREVPAAAAEMGLRALLVARASADIERLQIAGVPFPIHGEPTVGRVRQGAELARGEDCDLVIALGGGSTIDTGKAIAALLGNGGDPLDYLEVVGQAKPLTRPSAPFIAIPTTAGTGAEVTRNAVLASPEHRAKASLRSPHMLPRLAVVDPELTQNLPPALTATTGLDAITQLIEPYVSCRANPITDLYCVEGMRLAAGALRRAWRDGHDLAARTDMAFASLLGGLALANAGLGAVHGFAAPLGGMFDAPHGALCAALLPHAMRVNIAALRAPPHNASHAESLLRYAAARTLTGRSGATPEEGAAWVECLCRDLEIRPLGAYGVRPADVPALADAAARASSMKANPIVLTRGQLEELLTRAI
ncbi:MAG TPA: iron-containing alcohol dehydrogenase [Bryobacteraceae bacterium]|jgi:alcohol dehydrogenase class IV|nr:iron-containing alcohol dehydrogenase [Bryobacteraceae bacterium]